MMLSIFSCVCWPPECLLWSNDCSLPIFSLACFLILSCMSCLYILEITPSSVASFETIFFHSEGCLFTLFTVSFDVHELTFNQILTP